MFTNSVEAIDYIEHIKRKEKRENLNRMKKALEILGNPHKAYKIIHIAGTNGKGSTVSYFSKILENMNYRVGSFISPYVIKFNERIMINGRYIDDDDLVCCANRVKKVADIIYNEDNDVVTFFEFVTLMGFLYFKDKGCDYAVVEVGMGGILDATNVVDACLCVITNIGFDHMNSLGNTLFEIADKKLGIVKKENTLVTSVIKPLRPYFNEKLKNITDDIYYIDAPTTSLTFDGTRFTYKGVEYILPLIGAFQASNAMLAIKGIELLFGEIDSNLIQRSFNQVKWPGRMMVLQKNPYVIADGGHNIHGISAVVESMQRLKGNQVVKVLYTALADKDSTKMIEKLEEIADSFIFTSIPDARKADPASLAELSVKPHTIIDDYKLALDKAVSSIKENEILLITGSLHFISLVINYLNK